MSNTLRIIDGDYVLNQSGQPHTLSGADKAVQDLAEMLSVDVTADGFGAGLPTLLGRDEGTDPAAFSLEFMLRDAIEQGFARLVSLQRQSLTNRTPDELFARIANLQVMRQQGDPRVYRWRLDVLTVSGVAKSLKGRIQT